MVQSVQPGKGPSVLLRTNDPGPDISTNRVMVRQEFDVCRKGTIPKVRIGLQHLAHSSQLVMKRGQKSIKTNMSAYCTSTWVSQNRAWISVHKEGIPMEMTNTTPVKGVYSISGSTHRPFPTTPTQGPRAWVEFGVISRRTRAEPNSHYFQS